MIQLTSRDDAMLEWLGVVRIAEMDAIRYALAGTSGVSEPVHLRRAQFWVKRLEELGLVARGRPTHRDTSIIWPTQRATGKLAGSEQIAMSSDRYISDMSVDPDIRDARDSRHIRVRRVNCLLLTGRHPCHRQWPSRPRLASGETYVIPTWAVQIGRRGIDLRAVRLHFGHVFPSCSGDTLRLRRRPTERSCYFPLFDASIRLS